MRIIIVVLVLISTAAFAKAQGDVGGSGGGVGGSNGGGSTDGSTDDIPVEITEKPGYIYKLNLTRYATIASQNNVVDTQAITNRVQPIKYMEAVNAEHPFWVAGWVRYGKKNWILKTEHKDAISSCEEYEEGTWNNAIIKIVNKQLMPSGSCPVLPGTYSLYENLEVVVTSKKKFKCGNYYIIVNIDNDYKQLALQLAWKFVLLDDGSCIPQ